MDNDFEFIKPPVALKRRKVPSEEVNPIVELKRLGRNENGVTDEDEPPFNFQKMLRKTNFQRDSLKRAVVKINCEKEMTNTKEAVNIDVNKENAKCQLIVANGEVTNGSSDEMFSGEILPGVFLEGILIAL